MSPLVLPYTDVTQSSKHMPSKIENRDHGMVHGLPNTRFPLIHSLRQKASRAFLLRQYGPAWSTCLDALSKLQYELEIWSASTSPITPLPVELIELRRKLWVLYINIFGMKERQEQQERPKHSNPDRWDSEAVFMSETWNKVIDSFNGVEGDVDVEVTIACVLLCLNKNMESQARDIIERWLSTLPDSLIYGLEALRLEVEANQESNGVPNNTEMSRLWLNYEKVVELYVLHVLPKMAEWDTGRDFLQYNSIISVSRKEIYQQRLEKLYQRSLKPRKKSSVAELSSNKPDNNDNPTTYPEKNIEALIETKLKQEASKVAQPKVTVPEVKSSKKEISANGSLATRASSSSVPPKGTVAQQSLAWLQRWLHQVTQNGARNGIIIVLVILVLLGVFARRNAVSRAVGVLASKLWQTLRMGTSITYI
ncbi:hypothetical protein K493DRAFT_310146 [Basidiobolus meristosporus CBS 931.73]|uniref:Uncharacterized protein n=1 Tax=Basidiobolus meristosporus CBS 931.73 TaxID=1314790 RepID=A0A1Y1ZBD9_9FUNG|nr:hypothetical protein K493DRAFT_310146 [Basidiobolus meristosporus CBS 931.73]|eukprot:ORY07602.1 hypothetical protein K493DRAFT_310146 [Basidiobolus meristosporus CBS 931.73]